MINATRIEEVLRKKYPDLDQVGNGIFRGVDKHAEREYAVRYFDLTDRLLTTAEGLKKYQEDVLSDMYFSSQASTDLRWNHYLYFVTSAALAQSGEFRRAKLLVESDREYARKKVVLEEEIDRLWVQETPKSFQKLPADLATIWMQKLEEKGLGFVLDEGVTVPKAVQRIIDGHKEKASKVVAPVDLTPAEKAVERHFLKSLKISGFRPHPIRKEYSFGKVNLIVGTNGVGKTSLLDAIEYLYCGQNRRAGDLLNNTSLSSEMFDATENLITTRDTGFQRLRARHSHWYAKSEPKKLTLCDSFGKFNYLDTDAAVNLSVDSSQEQIGVDVTRLLMGAEAEKLSDRIMRVHEKLVDAIKDRNRDISSKDELLLVTSARLLELSKAPKLSDSLFSELLVALEQLRWRLIPTTKEEVAGLRDAMQTATSSVQLIKQLQLDVLSSDDTTLLQQRSKLLKSIEKALDLNEKQKSALLTVADTERKLHTAALQVSAFETLIPFASANLPNLIRQRDELRKSIDSLSFRLAPIGNFDLGKLPAPILDQKVTTALSANAESITDQNKRLLAARNTLKECEKTHGEITVLRQRLLGSAKDLIEKVPNPDHCPVCHTDFKQGELMIRMLTGVVDGTEERLSELQTRVREIEIHLQSIQEHEAELRLLNDFAGDSAASLSVGQVMKGVELARTKLSELNTEFKKLNDLLNTLAESGLTFDLLSKNLEAAGLSSLVAVEELESQKASYASSIPQLQILLKEEKERLTKIRQDSEELASHHSLDILTPNDKLVPLLRAQLSSLDTALQAKQNLSEFLIIDNRTSEMISVQLEGVRELSQKLITSTAREASDIEAVAKETKLIETLNENIEKAKTERGRLKEANTLLEGLSKQGASGELSKKILAENATEIGQTFAAIHVPNELDIKTNHGKFEIIRRETGKAIQLVEMSTGQRAAFALSLFLAMNARLKSGPRVMLFDDPIAHTDDINVLSFLDHLRDLSIRGTRQIFFATADSKLAGLFRHKFRFLGNNDFKEIMLTRED